MRGGFRQKTRIIDHTTGEVYGSIGKAAEGLYVSYPTLQESVKGKDRIEFKGHDLEMVRTGAFSGCRRILCVDTGTVYESYRDAAEFLGVSRGTLSNRLKGKQETEIGGHTIRRVE